jgi:lysophospholipase L1-like esterase
MTEQTAWCACAVVAFASLCVSDVSAQDASRPPIPMTARTRIVALGDSTTAGTPAWRSPIEAPPGGSGNEQSQYAYWLMQAHPEWEVLNRGVNGERSDEILDRFDRDVLSARPRAVVIIAGVNDVYQGRSADEVTKHLRLMYDRARDARVEVLAGTIIPFNTATPDQNRRMRSINAWIQREAQRDPHVVVVDTRRAVAMPDDQDRLVSSPDSLHPSVEGYHRMADAIRSSLERMLGADRAPGFGVQAPGLLD